MTDFLNTELFNVTAFNIGEVTLSRALVFILILMGIYSLFKDILINLIKMLYKSYKDKKLLWAFSKIFIAFFVFRSFVELSFGYALLLTPVWIMLFSFWSLLVEIFIEHTLEYKSLSLEERKSKKIGIIFILIINILFPLAFGILFYFFPMLFTFESRATFSGILFLLGLLWVTKHVLIFLSNVIGVNILINLFRVTLFLLFVKNVFSHFTIFASIAFTMVWSMFLISIPIGWQTFFLMKSESLKHKESNPELARESEEKMYNIFGHMTLLTTVFIAFIYIAFPILFG